jgi:hypothetical protein
MKKYFNISFLLVLVTVGLSACLDEKNDEMKFVGAWRLDHYYVDGQDETSWYMNNYREHVIYLEPNHTFKEQWIDGNGPYAINGTWSLADSKDKVILNDHFNEERTYHLKYTFFLSLKSGGKEWVFKKL